MRFLLGWCVVGLALSMAMVGCEKPDAPETVTEFDPEIDGKLPTPALAIDRKILDGVTKAAPTGAGPGPAEPSADAGVRQVLGLMKAAVAAGKIGLLADHYAPAKATVAKMYMTGVGAERAAMADAETVIKAQLDPSLVGKLTPIAGTYDGPWTVLADTEVDALTFPQVAGAILVVNSRAPQSALTFTKTADGQWVFTYLPWQTDSALVELARQARLAAARAQVFTSVADGVRLATINASNFNETVDSLTAERIAPLLNGELPTPPPGPTPPAPTPPGPTPVEPTPPEPTPTGSAGAAGTVTVRIANVTGGEVTIRLTGGTKVDQKLPAGQTVSLSMKPGTYSGSLTCWDGSNMAGKVGSFIIDKSEQWTVSLMVSGGMRTLMVAETDLEG